MKNIKKIRKFFNTTFLLIFFAGFFSLSQAQAAYDYGVGRVRSCAADGSVEGLDFNPFTGGNDVEFVMSNPVCVSVAAYAYTVTKVRIAQMNATCGNPNGVRIIPSPILDSIDLVKSTVKAAVNANGSCAASVLSAATSLTSTIAILGGIYGIAKEVYSDSQICGANWMGPNNKQFMNNTPNYKATVEQTIQSFIDSKQTSNLSFDNKIYREWYYGGIEFADNSDDDICPDVTQPSVDGQYPPQTYYMKGLETANFNCKKYFIASAQDPRDPRDGTLLSHTRFLEFKAAYDCCKSRAREYVCIEYGSEHKFCKVGTNCKITSPHPIYFQAKSQDSGRLACAQSFSLCPYNFSLGGGTDKCDFFQDGVKNEDTGRIDMITLDDVKSGNCSGKSEIRNSDCTYNDKAGRCRNYCQFMTNCTKTDLSDYQYVSSITSPYFSSACLDFTGDSRNRISYGTGFIAGSARHFSAPIAQCVKETLENVFYNRAGHTQCLTDANSTVLNQECSSGTAYKKGDLVESRSFFVRMQDNLHAAVKMVLTLSIVFYGTKLLFTGKEGVPKKEMLMFILKFALVLYFATGDAWQTMFFDGVYGASTVFTQMVFKIQTPDAENKRDGCQFGNISLEDGTQISSGTTYPQGKEYLAIWDTLDCKIARYLGFGPEISTMNVAKLILAGFFTGPVGIYFAIALMVFGLVLIAATLRALHIFLSSAIAIILMVYVSPLTICCSLFTKTNGIFKNWVTQLIGYCLQPIILFAYIAIFITVLDKTMTGSATFFGDGPNRVISCKEFCQNSLGQTVTDNPNCDRVGEKMVRPQVDSIACMVNYNSFGNWPGLEIIGIGVPFLIDFFASHTREKILTIAKASLIMYFLCYFMEQIPGITSALIMGDALPGPLSKKIDLFNDVKGNLGALQQRANRGIKKWGKRTADNVGDKVKEGAKEAGDQGKKVDQSRTDGTSSPRSEGDGGSNAA